jgi:transposase
MLVIGYSFGIRSERRLCDELHLNLTCRWFCRLGLKEPVPDAGQAAAEVLRGLRSKAAGEAPR